MKTINWDAEAAEKSGYEHFMLKEIHEQPKIVRDTINSVLKDGNISFESLTDEEMQAFKDAAAPIYESYREQIGDDVFEVFGYTFE